MKVSRRQFFSSVSFTALAVGTSSALMISDKILALSSSEAVKTGASSPMAKSTFESLLDTPFNVQLQPNESLPLQLVEVLEHPINPTSEQFSLTFRGPSQPFLAQNTYNFEHPQLGNFDLFITPIEVGQAESELAYQATINNILN